jgi:hypothetical protein
MLRQKQKKFIVRKDKETNGWNIVIDKGDEVKEGKG